MKNNVHILVVLLSVVTVSCESKVEVIEKGEKDKDKDIEKPIISPEEKKSAEDFLESLENRNHK
jgi:hypothetical protein